MENIKIKNGCSKWVIKPDKIQSDLTKELEEKHFICKCSFWVCGWRKGRINKTRDRIIDKVRKFDWPMIVRLARALDIKIA